MGWNAECVVNTVEISDACAAELLERFCNSEAQSGVGGSAAAHDEENSVYRWYSVNDVRWIDHTGKGRLSFETCEYVDYLNPPILDTLVKHGCTGDICFGDVEGPNKPYLWGYRVKKNGWTKLRGIVRWVLEPPDS